MSTVLQSDNSSGFKKDLGKLGEDHAKTYLLQKGYAFLEANYSTRFGEIDLIFLDGQTVVFVEVKTRTSQDYGHPEEAVNLKKLKHLQKAAEIFLIKNPVFESNPVRVDVVAIEMLGRRVMAARHYECVY